MIWFIFILTCINNIQGGLISIKKSHFLKNTFWNAGQEPSKTEKGFLYKVLIAVEDGSGLYDGIDYYFDTCHFLQSTNHRYVVLEDKLLNDINFYHESLKVNNSFMRFTFLFTDIPIKNSEGYMKYDGEKQFYTNFEPLEKMTENCCNDLKLNDIKPHVYNIEERISGLICADLLMLTKYISVLYRTRPKDDVTEIEEKANFPLYFFKDYSDCLNYLKEFVKDFRHISLIKDSESKSLSADYKKINYKAKTIKESEFMERLNEKFKNYLQCTNNYHSMEKEQLQILDQCFNRCSHHLKNMIFANETVFPVGCGYDMDYYITELSKHIYKSFKSCEAKYDTINLQNIHLIVKEMIDLIDYYFTMLLVMTVKDLCFPEYVDNHFAKINKNGVETLEDYITIETVVCDYHNMFVYIANLALKNEDSSWELLPYFHPISNENYNCKIVDGIEIKFEYPAKLGQINGIDEEENEIILVKDIDYFIEEDNKVYILHEILETKKIIEIELITPISFLNKRFKVNKYLN